METTDLLVIGGGVVGLTAALAFRRRHRGQRVVVLEKEPRVGLHASGRSSGVLHAGFYYSADSLKARYSVAGCRAWKDFCGAHGVAIQRCGKLVVARSPRDHAGLDELQRRAERNGVRIERVSGAEVQQIEPRARTVERALFSPDTATVDPRAVMAKLAEVCVQEGIVLRTGAPYLGRAGRAVIVPSGSIEAGVVLNAAGLYADRVAAGWGCGARWRLVPFRGTYVVGRAGAPSLSCCVYPVPDLEMPFLGIHLTPTPSGGIKIGPTAVPGRWRQDYGGLGGLRLGELAEQLRVQAGLWTRNAGVRRLAMTAAPKLSRRWLVRAASRLVSGLRASDFRAWGRPGVRAQLVEAGTGRLVQDFVVEVGPGSLHVLNAVSPAFTCALPFAESLVDRVEVLA
ncbi:MAG TPA: FAD-dependent oxidoreductase [Deltaproteobacteria bacterium]|nr:FAD-dependent oxidoreductase [Deltaproteobacteria bacterium]